jgi:hypothetical protein
VNLDAGSFQSRSKHFVDLAKSSRNWVFIGGGGSAPADAGGWPLSDAQSIMFNVSPSPDDPSNIMPNWGGTYSFSFRGKGDLSVGRDTTYKVRGVKYNKATNITTGSIVVPRNAPNLMVQMTSTQRDATAPIGSGFSDLRIIRPGYTLDSPEIFTAEFLYSLRPFSVIRYMNWLRTNLDPGRYDAPGHSVMEWSMRKKPTDATQWLDDGVVGIAWEYIIALSNQTKTHPWINIPVSATDDYVRQLARLMASTLDPSLGVYVEHSNEVWNRMFPQYGYNMAAACDEASAGVSALTNDGESNPEVWARRRHARRTLEIGQIFREEFGTDGAGRVWPVYAAQAAMPTVMFQNTMDWVSRTYGPPRDYFVGFAGASYYKPQGLKPTAPPAKILSLLYDSSDANIDERVRSIAIARSFGVAFFQYECGPNVADGTSATLTNRIRASRMADMTNVMLHDAVDNWFVRGGDLYMHFQHVSAYNVWGCWGLSEDVMNLNTPKWKAIQWLTGWLP